MLVPVPSAAPTPSIPASEQPVRPSFGEAVRTAKQSRKQACQARARRSNGDVADNFGVTGRDLPRLSRKAQLPIDRAAPRL